MIGSLLVAVAIDLGGVWHVAGDGIDADIRLPGTLADAGLGQEQSFETWNKLPAGKGVYVQERNALRLNWQYIGNAVYTREIDVPPEAECKAMEIVLERVMWLSTLKVDGKTVGSCDSLGTPHVYRFAPGELKSGRRKIEISVDNSRRYDFSGWSHGWGPTTQTRWNGIIGEFVLREVNPLRQAQVFARWPAKGGFDIRLPADVAVDAVKVDGLAVSGFTREGEAVKVKFDGEPAYWSEFHPHLYRLKISGGGYSHELNFAFRTVSTTRHSLMMNGKPFWVRGNVDNCQFPYTGYPAVTKTEWLRQFRIQKLNGCNTIRTHTWTPPKAAFEAADEIGFYILLETGYWADGNNLNRAIGRGHKALDDFCYRELNRLRETYGNHPSLISLGIGNELGACDFKLMDSWMKEIKAVDDRYLTIASTARKVCPSDDYMTTHDYPGVGMVRARHRDGTDWDYEDVYSRTPIPVIAHEVGQWPVYPLWNDIGKFSGLLRAYDWMYLRDIAVSNGTFKFQRQWHTASLKTSRLMYKEEVESLIRTPSCAGLQLLDVRDYTGQGEAWVGWLDAFFDAKPATAELRPFADFFQPVTTLARFERHVWKAGETFTARLQVRNMTEDDLPAGAAWPLSFAGRHRWVQLERPVRPGEIADVGAFSVKLEPWMARGGLELRFGENRWNVFVMDAPDKPVPVPQDVLFTDDPAKMADCLAKGGKVVYTGKSAVTGNGRFLPVYWSTVFFSGSRRRSALLGTWFDEIHGAFSRFPTEDWMDWQWRSMTDKSLVHVLTGLMPDGFTPVAMPVSDIHYSELLATMFEFKVGRGRAFVCGYPIAEADTPEARQLRRSVFEYVASDGFNPRTELTPSGFAALFAAPGATEEKEKLRYLTPFNL